MVTFQARNFCMTRCVDEYADRNKCGKAAYTHCHDPFSGKKTHGFSTEDHCEIT